MIFKKIFAILFCGTVLCTSLTVSACAETTSSIVESEITPAYEIASNARSGLNLSGQTAYCSSDAYGIETVSITVEQTLQKQGFLWLWSDVKDASWTTTVKMSAVAFDNTKSGLSSGKYRLKSVFSFTDKYGKTESITVYSGEKSI